LIRSRRGLAVTAAVGFGFAFVLAGAFAVETVIPRPSTANVLVSQALGQLTGRSPQVALVRIGVHRFRAHCSSSADGGVVLSAVGVRVRVAVDVKTGAPMLTPRTPPIVYLACPTVITELFGRLLSRSFTSGRRQSLVRRWDGTVRVYRISVALAGRRQRLVLDFERRSLSIVAVRP
jgi:hypothetical protein